MAGRGGLQLSLFEQKSVSFGQLSDKISDSSGNLSDCSSHLFGLSGRDFTVIQCTHANTPYQCCASGSF